MAAHKPENAGLWIGFRQTENAVVIPEGTGRMDERHAASAPSNAAIWIPCSGQAGYYGTVMMGEEEAVVGLRLKVQWNQVDRSRVVHRRKGDPGMTGA